MYGGRGRAGEVGGVSFQPEKRRGLRAEVAASARCAAGVCCVATLAFGAGGAAGPCWAALEQPLCANSVINSNSNSNSNFDLPKW